MRQEVRWTDLTHEPIAGHLAEAGTRVLIVESTSTGNALVLSKAMPYAVAGVLAVWNVAYARRSHRAGELLAAAARARGEALPPIPS